MQYLLFLICIPVVWGQGKYDNTQSVAGPSKETSSKNPGLRPRDNADGGAGGAEVCWISSYGRGVGTIPKCASNLQNDAGLCYTPCPPDYKSVGPICWPNEISYARGAGTIPNSCGDKQMDGGLCYNRCPSGFKPVGPVCWRGLEGRGRGAGTPPNRCPGNKEYRDGLCYTRCKGGFRGDGPVCWNNKKQIPRGVGLIPNSCGGNDLDAGLCYQKCKPGYKGIGPVCWQDTCPSAFPTKCGALCVATEETCKQTLKNLAEQGVNAILSDPFSAMIKAIELITSLFKWPQCT